MTRKHSVPQRIEVMKGPCPMAFGWADTLRRYVISLYRQTGLGALSAGDIRRGVRLEWIGVSAIVILFAVTGALHAEPMAGKPPLTMVSWGGAYTKSQMMAFVIPYRQEKNRWVNVENYTGGLDRIRSQVASLNVKWDLVDMEISNSILGCREGLFERIDHDAVFGRSEVEDFYPEALLDCAVGENIFATVVAYSPNTFSAAKPSTLADFFDLERFPGARGLRNSPVGNLEWALIADGVPVDEVYSVLSIDSGVERAFKVLDRIKQSIVWWAEGTEPLALLHNKEVVMTSAWSGRIFDAIKARKEDLSIIWDGQIWNMDVWVIPKGAINLKEALEFIAFASDPKRMAVQADNIAYSPVRKSAMAFIDDRVRKYLPTAKENAGNVLRIGYEWWATHPQAMAMEARFEKWRKTEPWRYDFNRLDMH